MVVFRGNMWVVFERILGKRVGGVEFCTNWYNFVNLGGTRIGLSYQNRSSYGLSVSSVLGF